MNIPLVLAVAGILWYANRAKKFISDYRITFSDISLDWGKTLASLMTQFYFTVKLNIVNPSNFSTKLNAVNLNVYQGGKQLATLQAKEQVEIGPNTTTPIKISTTVPTLNLLARFKPMIDEIKSGRSVTVNVQGYAEFPSGRLTVNENKILSLA